MIDMQTKQRLYISIVGLAAIGLLATGISVLNSLAEVRSAAMTECLKDGIYLFDFCYRKTNQEISPTLFNYLSPFLPSAILIWTSWLFKLNFQTSVDTSIAKRLRKTVFWVGCIIAALGCFLPLYIVLEKSQDDLSSVLIYQLFITPWIAVAWLCVPLMIQKLLDPEKKMIEFLLLRKITLVVIFSPIIATITLIARQIFNF